MARPLTVTAVLTALALTASAAAVAEQRTLTLDPAKSTVHFTLGATLHTVHGSAPVTHGEVAFDSDGGAASGQIAVDASRADTGSAKRDREMHGKILMSASHPSVVLHLTRVEGRLPAAGGATLTVHGTLELLGRGHQVAVPVRVIVQEDHVTFEATLEVPYVAWGLHDPSTFLLKVEKLVTVTISGAGTLAAVPGAAGSSSRSAQDQPQP
jgi:polyisoprenoid-binding protein YceI